MKKIIVFLISVLVISLFFISLLFNIRSITPPPHMDDMGSGTLLDSLFAIALSVVVLYSAAGLGWLLIKPFKFTSWSHAEKTVIALPLGLACIAYGEFFMGLLGWLKPIHHIAWLMVITIVSIKFSSEFLSTSLVTLVGFRSTWKNFSVLKKVFLLIGILAILLALFLVFTPAWDYDGLMYHLEGPRLFLQKGKIIPITDNWFTFYPATYEMLYMLGMGLGSDIFARLMHFSSLILLLLSTYSFGKRLLNRNIGWLAAAIMMGIPILYLWGILAYVDLTWALFQFLSVALFMTWIQQKQTSLIILAGILQGLSLGCKYPAITNAAILGFCVILFSFKGRDFSSGLRSALGNTFYFGFFTILIASPWYMKNFFWTGSPIFPLYLQQDMINPTQIHLWMKYIANFGVGREWYNYLLLPFSIYLRFDKFASFMVSMDMPSPIFLICWAYPFIRKRFSTKDRQALNILGALTALQFVAWALGSQQNRFMMPFFPNLSIIAAAVLLDFSKRVEMYRLGRIVAIGLIGGMLVSSLVFMGIYHYIFKPHELLLGTQTKEEFLEFILKDWKGMQYINEELPSSAKVFMPWNGKGYYCIDKCLPDVDHSKWTALVQDTSTIVDVKEWMIENQITHLLISREDISYFLTSHDINGIVRTSYEFLVNDLAPKCTNKVYADNWVLILEFQPEKLSCH